MPSKYTLEERFWAKVDRAASGCWEWQASIRGDGYGQLHPSGGSRVMLGSHRVSWEIHYGPIPDGMWVLHHCDNKRCVRPDHLYLGTRQDNFADTIARGQYSPPPLLRGEQANGARLTAEAVREIRAAYPATSQVKLAARYGVNKATICAIIKRRIWKHVT